MTQVSLNLMGFAQGNAQMTAEVWNPATNLKIADAPVMADGSVRLANIASGAYQVIIRHPNLVAEVATQTIYVTPAGKTNVSILIDPTKFKHSAIVDLPEANLAPIATMTESIELAAKGLTNKMPGEILTAAWANGVAFAIENLAHTVTLLARSVTPVGHNHLEYENKINELSTNFQSLVQTLAESTVRMQRRFEIDDLAEAVESVLAVGNADAATRRTVLDVLASMKANIKESPQLYSKRMRIAADTIKEKLAAMVAALPATSPTVIAYNAVIKKWASSFIRDLRDELFQPKVDRAFAIAQLDAPLTENITS